MSFKRGTMMTALKPPMPREFDYQYYVPSDGGGFASEGFDCPEIQAENLLKSPDDLTDGAYWGTTDVTVTEPSTGVFRLTKDVGAAWKNISQAGTNWYPAWLGTYSFIFEVRAGTLDNAQFYVDRDSAGVVDSITKISGTGTVSIQYGTNGQVTGLDSNWTKIIVTGSGKGWTTQCGIVFYPDGQNSNTGYLEVRNFQVILGDQPDEKPRPVNQEAAYPMMAYKPHWRLTPDGNGRFSVVDGSVNAEILGNIGFETAGGGGADIWASWDETAGDGALANETVTIHGGSDSCKVTAGATANTLVLQAFSCTALAPYKLTFWTYGDGANAGRYRVWDQSNGADIIATTSTGVTAASWTQVTVYFTAPAGCVLASLRLMCSTVDTTVTYFDDVSLHEQNTSGLVSIGEADSIEIAPTTGATPEASADFEMSCSFTFETGKNIYLNGRFLDANTSLLLQIGSDGKIYLKQGLGAGQVTMDTSDVVFTDGEFYRVKWRAHGTALSASVDDLSDVVSGTHDGNAAQLAQTGAYISHNYATNDMKLICEPYPKRTTSIIVAGGKATAGDGDPTIWLTQTDGSAFTAAVNMALLYSITSHKLATAFTLIDKDMSASPSGVTGVTWDGAGQQYGSNGSYNLYTDNYVVGTERTLMSVVRASTFGAHLFQHVSGNQWKRFGAATGPHGLER
jgi:hypothetical protein